MFFKNLQIYRLPANWAMTSDLLAAALVPQSFVAPTSSELIRSGWGSPRENDQLVHAVAGQFLIKLVTEKKLLPSSVINAVAKDKADKLEEAQGFRPGKKVMKELKEQAADELLPRAFPIRSETWCWIDPVNGWLAVDASSATRADDVVKLLLKSVERMPLESLRVERSPSAVMTAWLDTDEAPTGFTIDQDAKLQATGESRATVRYAKHTLAVDEMRRHIATGKLCTSLAMTWRDKISIVLTESLAIKSIKPLDVLREGTTARDDAERFDSDFALMAGELNLLLCDLMAALGGEAADLVSPARTSAASAEKSIKLAAKLYQARDDSKVLLGDGYKARMDYLGGMVQSEMRAQKTGAIEAAMAICNRQASPGNNIFLMAAAVELVEPSHG